MIQLMKVKHINLSFIVYFLVNGTAELVLKKHDDMPYVIIEEGKYFHELNWKGYYFGEIDIRNIHSESRLFTVKAKRDCELLALSKNVPFFSYYPI